MKNKMVKLVHGILVVSEDFIVVKGKKTEKSDYAAVLAERSGGIPHYVILLDKPLWEMTDDEQGDVYRQCGMVYPEIAALMVGKTPAVIENGRIKNVTEWQMSSRLGLFNVPEVEDENHLYLNIGIIREG